MATPVRLQLSRRKGFNLQELSRATNGLEAVNCARPGKRGNPYKVGLFRNYSAADAVRDFQKWLDNDAGARAWAGAPPSLHELRDKNLACWCKLCERHSASGLPLGEACSDCEPCHTMPLLELSNAPEKAG